MVKSLVESLSIIYKDAHAYMPPGIFLAIATAFLGDGKFLKEFRMEFVGSLLMIACTFSAGKWIGSEDMSTAWFAHFLGVIAADYFGGGPHVNPAVTLSMWCLGKSTYTEAYVRVGAQMAGGLVAFPLFHMLSDIFEWTPFGGPEFSEDEEHPVEAFLSELGATFLLLILIYVLNWELNFGTYHYWIKQSLTAIGIRALIESFPTAGPAMNPMLATAWNVFGVGTTFEFPSDLQHYFVYWVAPSIAAIVASIMYVIYAGGKVFGATIPIGPMKRKKEKKE
mmetsp:Transcript_394/g.552  ORF Transcript_394/g.552 Transcript_394/m.552 type:complete len:280 (-) Transcript_394:2186-3025(-)|eukprot:CAMPEP_0194255410 /NCGR_PEP_ID=MMETSP0158-20130606/34332_1 /TAXON_ID=33649 /ORGANISM="Thalassionema nitzschioides, Strain L26-B" /LENGTH=279 /DNA_ID=CAMNT_0038993749 /DNA_START=51 /DNA_END=890 /DNA_ORIENTATION=+